MHILFENAQNEQGTLDQLCVSPIYCLEKVNENNSPTDCVEGQTFLKSQT